MSVHGTSAPPVQHGGRMVFFDHLRAFVVLLVIVFHIAIGFMAKPPQWWYVVDTQKSAVFDLFVMNTDVFIMPALFFIAGYFAVPVLRRKGTAVFLREKFFRITVPWIFGVLVLAPAITYMIWFSRTDSPPAYAGYLVNNFFTAATFNHAHYWFLGVLSWFFLLTAGIYSGCPQFFQQRTSAVNPGAGFLIAFGFLTAVAFFIPNLFFHADAWFSQWLIISFQPTRLLICGAYFALGILAWRNHWFSENGYQPQIVFWTLALLAMLVVFNGYRLSFLQPGSAMLKAGHALVHAFFCLAGVFFLLAVFQKYCNGHSVIGRQFSAHSYSIYYVHQLVVLPIAYLVQKLIWPVWLKYLTVSAGAILLCWLVAAGLDSVIGILRSKHNITPTQKG